MADTTYLNERVRLQQPSVSAKKALTVEYPEFETQTWPHRLCLPFMTATALYVHAKKLILGAFNKTPKINCWYVDGISLNSRRVVRGAARWPALDACYNFAPAGKSRLVRTIDTFWMTVRNAQAVRNRLKIAKRELAKAILTVPPKAGPVRILSLAAGTAQGVIEVAAEMKTLGISTEILLIDIDATALNHAEMLARAHGIALRTVKGDVIFFDRFVGDFKSDIVEMMGLVDYLRRGMAVKLFRKIWRYLPRGGHFFTCHVHPNAESYFLKQVVNWDMIYRSKNELIDLLVDGEFLSPQLVTEYHGIHSVAIARKQ